MQGTRVSEGGITQALTFTRRLHAPPVQIYRAFTNETALREWLSDRAHVEAREGGGLFLGWDDVSRFVAGRYTALAPGEHIELDWQGLGDPGATHVTIDLVEQQTGTELTLVHAGFGTTRDWERVLDSARETWLTALENLKAHVESGEDLRIARRPFLGITLGEPPKADATGEPGLAVPEGVPVTGAIGGTGAERAGLRNRDVIVGIDGRRVRGVRELVQVLDEHLAGDVINVEILREAERLVLPLELSQRPAPEVPDDPALLADAVRTIYDGLAEELDALLDGVSDEEASQQPAAGEWSAKQVLAHLIHSEQDGRFWLATAVSGTEALNFPENLESRIAATLAVTSSLDALRALLRSEWTETEEMVRRLPASFVSQKRTYRRVGEALLMRKFHPHEHYQQIKDAILAARA